MRKKLISLLVFIAIVFTAIWSASGTLDSSDAGVRARVTNQLLTEGQLVMEINSEGNRGALYRDREGTYSARFGLGQSIYFMPFWAVSQAATSQIPFYPSQRSRLQTFLFSVPVLWSVLALNFWLCLKLAVSLGAGRLPAYLLAFVATWGSSYWQMAKQAQEEVQLSLLLLFAVLGFVNWLRRDKFAYIWLSGIVAATGLIFRPTAITIVTGVAGIYAYEMLLGQRRSTLKQSLLPIGLTIIGGLLIGTGYNFYKTGNPLDTGYDLSGWFTQDWLPGLTEPIIGLDRGIWLTNLWFLPGCILSVLSWKTLKHEIKVLLSLCLYLLISSVAIYAKCCWAGDITYGARYQVHIVPLLCVITGMASLTALRQWFPIKQLSRRILLPLSLGFFLLQIPSVSFIHGLEIYQANIARLGYINQSPTSSVGQIRLRYTNFFHKLIRGQPVDLDYPDLTETSKQVLADASRWNFWPWLAEKRLPSRLIRHLRSIWWVIVVASLSSWGLAFWLLCID